ncbi:MAG TPA: 3D-(3,5/4)-trihydroxycyclohexane-1,2-dione acylhydrolase (decyclizing), partial [Casimicrobiaceae bacterium]
MKMIRMTMAQALVRYLAALVVDEPGTPRLFAGVWAIFGHGNVAGVGEALFAHRDVLPTYRAQNEQAMAHAAIAYAKAHMRRRMMACTTSIGPGATNMVTAAALAHVNRLPVLLLPGDVFITRAPDPVLQQVEDFHDGTVSANDCFKPVSRYFDRIAHPAQLLTALPRAIRMLTDPAHCGPVTLALPQDVQTMAHDYPEEFFAPAPMRFVAPASVAAEIDEAAALLREAKRPLIVAGGGVLYAGATGALQAFAARHGVPVAETQAGKGALPWDDPMQQGAIGVTGSPAANAAACDCDVVIGLGTRLQDFTTGSHSMFANARLVSINAARFDAQKWCGLAVTADAGAALASLSQALEGWRAEAAWTARATELGAKWRADIAALTDRGDVKRPYEADVIGAVQRSARDSTTHDIVVCASGTLPGELHKLWRTSVPGGYHLEYGYSCMGYEIAGGLGVKMARPEREVVVLVGDGAYLMMNSEIMTSVMLGMKLV